MHRFAQFNQITPILIYIQIIVSQTNFTHKPINLVHIYIVFIDCSNPLKLLFFHILKPLFSYRHSSHILPKFIHTHILFNIRSHFNSDRSFIFKPIQVLSNQYHMLRFRHSFHTVWLYHRHRLFSQTHKTFS